MAVFYVTEVFKAAKRTWYRNLPDIQVHSAWCCVPLK